MPNPAETTLAPASAGRRGEPVFHVRGMARIYGEGTAAVTALAGGDFDLFAGELIVQIGRAHV